MSSGEESPVANTPKEPEVKFVLSGQPTGWWAMAKDVREFDVEKVQSCKEDIDTLLVFAGLFSAVLSAFLVAVYPNLQPAPSDRMIYAIERVATQTAGYRVNLTDGTFIAANIPPLSPPPFQASDQDIRVNVLWFASLIISLITASFGMLVKQWLREYLASGDPSAIHRLRLRHFREPQMKTWMVYEIAGLLPILLHLSLGLFFVGLCYFTSSVHSSIGYTTIPLVVGWALCFFAATSLPIFFPRCPYKMAFLKVLVVQLHRSIRRFARWADSRMRKGTDEGENSNHPFAEALNSRVARWHARISPVKHFIRRLPHRTCYAATRSWVQICSTAEILRARIKTMKFNWTRYRKYLENSCRSLIVAAQTIPDEAILVENSSADVAILISVDAIQGNDEMLGTAITEALHYTRPRPCDAIDLVVQLLTHRVPTLEPSERSVAYWPFRETFPLDNVRPQARENILLLLRNHLDGLEVNTKECPDNDCYNDNTHSVACRHHAAVFCAFLLAISIPIEHSHPSVSSFLRRCFAYDGFASTECSRWLCHGVVSTQLARQHERSLQEIQARMITAITKLIALDGCSFSLYQGVECFANILSVSSNAYGLPRLRSDTSPSSFPWETWRWPNSSHMKFKYSCIMYWIEVASRELDTDFKFPPDIEIFIDQSSVERVVWFALRQFHDWQTEEVDVHSTLQISYHRSVHNSFQKMAYIAFKRKDTALIFTDAFFTSFRSSWLTRPQGVPPFRMRIVQDVPGQHNLESPIRPPQTDPAIGHAILQLVASRLEEYRECDITFLLRLCHIMGIFFITVNVSMVGPILRKECRRIFSMLAASMRIRHSIEVAPLSDDDKLSSGLLYRLEWAVDNCMQVVYSEGCVHHESECPCLQEGSIFPDALVNILSTVAGKSPEPDRSDPCTPQTQPNSEPDPSLVDSPSILTYGTYDAPGSCTTPDLQTAYTLYVIEEAESSHETYGGEDV